MRRMIARIVLIALIIIGVMIMIVYSMPRSDGRRRLETRCIIPMRVARLGGPAVDRDQDADAHELEQACVKRLRP